MDTNKALITIAAITPPSPTTASASLHSAERTKPTGGVWGGGVVPGGWGGFPVGRGGYLAVITPRSTDCINPSSNSS